jgi:hypothetical protein
MRICLGSAALLFCAGCQILPTQAIECVADTSGRCPPVSFVLGQPDGQSNLNLHFGMAEPYDALIIGTKLFVADCGNSRVLGWNTFPVGNQQLPDFVLGQPTLDTNIARYNGISATSLNCPNSLAFGIDPSGQQHLIVGDRGDYRIL